MSKYLELQIYVHEILEYTIWQFLSSHIMHKYFNSDKITAFLDTNKEMLEGATCNTLL